jgi:hypothetical protein
MRTAEDWIEVEARGNALLGEVAGAECSRLRAALAAVVGKTEAGIIQIKGVDKDGAWTNGKFVCAHCAQEAAVVGVLYAGKVFEHAADCTIVQGRAVLVAQ